MLSKRQKERAELRAKVAAMIDEAIAEAQGPVESELWGNFSWGSEKTVSVFDDFPIGAPFTSDYKLDTIAQQQVQDFIDKHKVNRDPTKL